MEIKKHESELNLVSLYDAERDGCDVSDFDYIEEDERHSPRLFCYKGELHDAGEFLSVPPDSLFADDGWQGYFPWTYFSGLVLKYSEDFESVVIGYYFN